MDIDIFLCRRSTILWSLGRVNEHTGEWAEQNGGGNRLQRMHKDIHNLAIVSYQSFSKYAGPPLIATAIFAIFAQRNGQTFATAKQKTTGKSNI